MASDAFFPFTDGLDRRAAAGVTAAIQPGGSMRDEEVIAAADQAGIAMLSPAAATSATEARHAPTAHHSGPLLLAALLLAPAAAATPTSAQTISSTGKTILYGPGASLVVYLVERLRAGGADGGRPCQN